MTQVNLGLYVPCLLVEKSLNIDLYFSLIIFERENCEDHYFTIKSLLSKDNLWF